MTVGFGSAPQFLLNLEHPAAWLAVGTKCIPSDGSAGIERKYVFSVDAEIVRLDARPAQWPDGESYQFNMPAIVTAGQWIIEYRSSFGECVDPPLVSFRVDLPENSLLVNLP